jgi:hypothetical protein
MRAPVLSVVGRANLPGRAPGKRALAAAAAALLACAGCGTGGGSKPRVVRGDGFRFDAPADWRVVQRGRTLEAAAPAGPELLWVTRLRLLHPYRPALWGAVVPELDRVAGELAREVAGKVEDSRTVVVAGRRARRYEIRFVRDGGTRVEHIVFLLEGRTEYQLLCRVGSGGDDLCGRFFAAFALG